MCLQLADIFLHFRDGVRNGVGKADLHIFLVEVVPELQLIVSFVGPIPAQPLDELHVIALPLPPRLPLLLDSVQVSTASIGLHAFAVQVLLLDDVADVQLDSSCVLAVPHLEVVPVRVPPSVGIASHKAVKFGRLHPDGQVQVAALEVRVKGYLLLVCTLAFGGAQRGNLGLFLANLLDRLLDGVDLDLVFLAIFPAIVVVLVELDGIDVPGSSVNDAESRVKLYF